jgi:nicotinate-nucleotide pyrophosphorylase (carboxylating)
MDFWKIDRVLLQFLEEDIGHGDITTEGVFRGERARAVMVAKEEGICAGLPFSVRVFELLGGVKVLKSMAEGERFKRGDVILELEGPADVLLKGERVALNLLQRLSGIATLTGEFVKRLEGTKTQLLDTRKTTPGLRFFEKYAVRVGGGTNHRFALYDMVLIKDNHKRVAGSLSEAVKRVRERLGPAYKVEVEVESLQELEEALACEVDMVMLDNFSLEEVRQALKLIKGRVKVEVSGNITLENVRDYALEGVDYISTGAITHSARWVDVSMSIIIANPSLAKSLIDPNIKSYHLFRKTRTQKVYRLLKEYRNRRILSILFAKLLLGEKVKLIVDGTILEVANLNRARTQRIKRFSGKAFWGKKKRNLYSEHYKEKVRFEEMYYGVLVMVVCDSEGIVYDLWFHPASYHEVRSLRIRYRKSRWLRFLVDKFGLMGDRGYRGCEYVEVCESKEQKGIRQVVEGVNSQIKLFNRVSRWRKGITLLRLF